jgi:hypothetical protein
LRLYVSEVLVLGGRHIPVGTPPITGRRRTMATLQQATRKERLALDTLRVETFEVGVVEWIPKPTFATGIDSTCPCCSEGFPCTETKPLPCTG